MGCCSVGGDGGGGAAPCRLREIDDYPFFACGGDCPSGMYCGSGEPGAFDLEKYEGDGCSCHCEAVQSTISSISEPTPGTATVIYTAGRGGAEYLYVADVRDSVLQNCPSGSGCIAIIRLTAEPGAGRTVNVSGLSAGTTYYFKIRNCNASCCTDSPIASYQTIAAGNAQIRSVAVPVSTNTCQAVGASTDYLSSSFVLTPPGTTKSSSGGSYALWENLPLGVGYIISQYTPPTDYVLKLACWSRDTPASSGTGLGADITSPSSTVTWNLGFTNGVMWTQTMGGDVYAATTLRSYIPSSTTPRFFNLAPTQGSPGVVTYGTSYDFDHVAGVESPALVSSSQWLVNDTLPATDYYAVMVHRFGSPAPTHTGDTTYSTKPASGTYFVDGNLTIDSTAWSIPPGESIVVLVSGNLTIATPITLTGTGFVAFIVKGDITIDSTLGGPSTSDTPVLEGIYITSPTGVFKSSASTTPGSERFVAQGIFVAGSFDLKRDLDSVTANPTTSAELFIYNPALLLSMPDKMRDHPVTWQEVAP